MPGSRTLTVSFLAVCGFAAAARAATCSLPDDCWGDYCTKACCPTDRDDDPYCPNCEGSNFTCLAANDQMGLGQSPAYGGTFNDFGYKLNTGFCKYQAPSPGTGLVNASSMGPTLLSSRRVAMGVGLSQAQFGAVVGSALTDGAVACGMCLEVTAQQATWDCDLTVPTDRYDSWKWPNQSVIVMVADQCIDYWSSWADADNGTVTQPTGNCATGHIDFDVYPSDGDVSWVGVEHLTWRAVDCPVDDVADDASSATTTLPVQFAFSSTTASEYYLAFHIWDARTPVERAQIEVECYDGSRVWVDLDFSSNGWYYQGQTLCSDTAKDMSSGTLNVAITSVYGETLNETLSVPTSTWEQVDGWIAWPPVAASSNFATSLNPPSAVANVNYAHCVSN